MKYSKEDYINKIIEIVNSSEFISKDIIDYVKTLENIEEIQKILVLVYKWLEQEKAMSEQEKNILSNKIIEVSKKKIENYKTLEKEIRKEAEEIEKKEDSFDETLLNF